jgi:hypothetical protein
MLVVKVEDLEIEDFIRAGGNMQLAKPDVLGVRQDPTKGGYIDDTASNAGIVRGRSHEQGGVQLPYAEVEGQESIVESPYTGETQVHSDELGTADVTNQLISQKGQLEEQLGRLSDNIAVVEQKMSEEPTTIRRNSFKRQYDTMTAEIGEIQQAIAEIDAQVEQMYQQQEQMKQESGMQGEEQPMMKFGGDYPAAQSDSTKVKAPGEYTHPFPQQISWKMHMAKTRFMGDDQFYQDLPLQDYVSAVATEGLSRGYDIPKHRLDSLYGLPNTWEHKKNAQKLVDSYRQLQPGEERKFGGTLPKHKWGDNIKMDSNQMNNDFIFGDNPSNYNMTPVTGLASWGSDENNFSSFPTSNTSNTSSNRFSNPFTSDNMSKIGKGLELAAPFLDNLHAKSMEKRLRGMDIPKPILDKPTYLDPTHDVSGQLADIDRYTASTSKGIMDNVSDSRIGRSVAGSVQARGVGMRGNVISQKINQETNVRNMNRQIQHQTNMSNTDKLNQYKLAQFDKQIQTDIAMPSQNMANVRDEIIGMLDRRDMRKFQDQQIAIQSILAGDTGVDVRNFAKMLPEDAFVRAFVARGYSKEEAKELYTKNRK